MHASATVGVAVVAALLPASTRPAAAEGDRGVLLDRIDALVADSMEATQTPGIAVAVRHRGELVLARGYGFADVENRVPATEHTVFRIGSVTKQFTAAAVLKLVESGQVALDDPITKHLPDYPVGEFHVTVGQLLDHTSRIKGYTDRERIAIFEVDPITGEATHLRLERWGQLQRGTRRMAGP